MDEQNNGYDTEALKEKLKDLVDKGNVSRIQVRKDDNVILNVPVNAGLAGGVLGMIAAPWAVIAGTVATLGLNCSVDVVKEDGEILCLTETEIGKKAVSAGTLVMDTMKNVVSGAVAGVTGNRDPSVIETDDYEVDDDI